VAAHPLITNFLLRQRHRDLVRYLVGRSGRLLGLVVVAPSFKAKTECIPLCVPGSSFKNKATNSNIESKTNVLITSNLLTKAYYKF
jgi:hypothetical protein